MKRLLRRVLLAVLGLFAGSVLLVLLFRWVPPPTSAFMLEADIRPVHQQWVSRGNAYLAGGAARGGGLGGPEIPRSSRLRLRGHRQGDRAQRETPGRRVRGASTISQQTAKNLFLWSGRSYIRKGLEAYFTVLLETLWPKHRILEMYLNIAQFGPDVYGVEEASRRSFRQAGGAARRA